MVSVDQGIVSSVALFSAVLGFGIWKIANERLVRCMRGFAAGTFVSLAIVHLTPSDPYAFLSSLCVAVLGDHVVRAARKESDEEDEHDHRGERGARGDLHHHNACHAPGETCYLLDASCVAHNVVLGLAAGATPALASRPSLVVGLALHQLAEGVALASVGRMRKGAHVLVAYGLFCLAMPTAILVGIPSSPFVTSIVYGASAGFLVHSAIVHLMTEELSRCDTRSAVGPLLYVAFVAGAAAMTLLVFMEDDHGV